MKIFNKKYLFIILFILLLIIGFWEFYKLYKKSNLSVQNSENSVNIIFNTDKNYFNYTQVAMMSAIKNKSKQSIYNIYIFCVDLNKSQIDKFISYKQKDVNIIPILVKLDDVLFIDDSQITERVYISKADFFKFLMPKLLPNVNKALYLDSDILVLKDLSELYNHDISNNYLGAVLKYPSRAVEWLEIYTGKEKFMYNCGVILFNLKRIRDDNLLPVFINTKRKEKRKDYRTQRVFNKVIPISDIKILSPIYNNNIMLKENLWSKGAYVPEYKKYATGIKSFYKPLLNDFHSVKALDKASVIIHYSGEHYKPWNTKNSNLKFYKEWWHYAKMVNPQWTPKNNPFK